MALSECIQEVSWIRMLLKEITGEDQQATKIYQDNEGAIKMTKQPGNHGRTKHIDVRYHFTREKVQGGEVEIVSCPTKEMVADLLTKSLARGNMEQLRRKMGVVSFEQGRVLELNKPSMNPNVDARS